VGQEDDWDDDALLLATVGGNGEAFAAFYRRHLPAVLAFARRRTGSSEAAADVTAEVFAAALVACDRYRPGEAPAIGWLLGIARNKLRELARRGRRSADARRLIGIVDVVDGGFSRAEELIEAGAAALTILEALPPDQRAAVWGRVVDEKDYERLARELDCSEQLVRQRVSRGLRTLRARLGSDG
jgi:RNA polymerase sigma factor (sigma-70 family)